VGGEGNGSVGAEAYAVHVGAEEDADVADDGYGARRGGAFGVYSNRPEHGVHG